jgi:hypothetical protein
MSQQNVKVVHRYAAALNAREVPEELLAPDFVMVNATTAVTGLVPIVSIRRMLTRR